MLNFKRKFANAPNELVNQLENIYDEEICYNFGCALIHLEEFFQKYPEFNLQAQLEPIISDYHRFNDCWLKGFPDEKREEIYIQLRQRTAQLVQLALQIIRGDRKRHLEAEMHGQDMSYDSMRQHLESYVTDLAMLDLEPKNLQNEKRVDINKRHADYMDMLYEFVVTSSQWSELDSTEMFKLLTLPTIDSIDVQLIVSAITVNVLSSFDERKLQILGLLYEHPMDEYIRQRAFVGWALASNVSTTNNCLYPSVRQWTNEFLTRNKNLGQELTELQIQIIYCRRAIEDHQTIAKEIMPDLMKNESMISAAEGMDENEDDVLQNILHPEAEDEQMEKIEKQFKRIQDMQSSGADIYYGGFAIMKDFPFFSTESHWLVPYYEDHPDIHNIFNATRYTNMIRSILATGPFCDSDKYSFVLGIGKVFDRLPANMVNMVDSNSLMMIKEVNEEERHLPAYIRRIYVQDLYRFYSLHDKKSELDINPFDDYQFHIITSPLFKKSFNYTYPKIASMLMKLKMYDDAGDILAEYPEEKMKTDLTFLLLAGSWMTRGDGILFNYDIDEVYEMALKLQPDNIHIKFNLANAYEIQHKYDQALVCFRELVVADPDNPRYLYRLATILIQLKQFDEANHLLFRLNYEYPDNLRVSATLGWCLLLQHKTEQAEPLLIQANGYDGSDRKIYEHLAMYYWTKGDIQKVAQIFSEKLVEKFKILRPNDVERYLTRTFDDYLDILGISKIDRKLMSDYLLTIIEA